jgi:GldL N-terminal domain
MKRLIYISGLISAIVLTTGTSFKIEHWPGAGILLTIAIGFFALFFVPAALMNNYKQENKNAYLYISIFITLLFSFSAALFKIQHWPGAGIVVTIALITPFVIFLPAYIVYFNKSPNKDITKFIAVMFLLVFVGVMDALLSAALR